MAEPATPFLPPPDNPLLIVRELKTHVDTFAEQLQNALENHELSEQDTFLKNFVHNIHTLDKLLKSIVFEEMNPDVRPKIEEITSVLARVLMIPSVENPTSSTKESDPNHFLTTLLQFPESSRILIQELRLLSQDLGKYL